MTMVERDDGAVKPDNASTRFDYLLGTRRGSAQLRDASLRRVVETDGTVCYYNHEGELHREDGPAVEDANGDRWWYLNGQRHRDGGPAVECADGVRAWWHHGEFRPDPDDS